MLVGVVLKFAALQQYREKKKVVVAYKGRWKLREDGKKKKNIKDDAQLGRGD